MTPESAILQETFFIVNKRGEKVPFLLNEVQQHYDNARTNRDIILKARQEGFSSFIDALITLHCLTTRNIRAVLIAHDRESTEKLFDRCRFFLSNLKDNMEVDLTRSSRREFYFKDMNSTFYIGTAGSESFGRGDTINLLHCSEAAMWPDPQSLTAGLFEAVPRDGTIWIESTANGAGNWFHMRCLRAMENRSRFRCHFYPWYMFEEYSLKEKDWPRDWKAKSKEEISLLLGEDENEIARLYGLTLGQLAWRREKINEMDDSELANGANLFPQEYPASPEEAFIASGLSVFKYIPPAELEGRLSSDRCLLTFRDPCENHTYILGVDISAGVGADRSIIWGLDCDNFEQVLEWSSSQIDPDELAYVIAELAKRYNMAQIVPELNNHGIATVAELRKIYPVSHIIQRYSYDKREAIERLAHIGWLTTQKTKSQLVTNLRKALRAGLRVYSKTCRSELSTYVQTDTGSFEAQSGCYDDRVIAAALAVTGFKHLYNPLEDSPQPLVVPQFSFNAQRRLAIGQFVERNGDRPSDLYGRIDSSFVQ